MRWVPLFLSNDQDIFCPERHKHDGRSASFTTIGRKVSSVTVGSSKEKGPIILFFIKAHHILTFGECCSRSITS
jgi:hypothetical protein